MASTAASPRLASCPSRRGPGRSRVCAKPRHWLRASAATSGCWMPRRCGPSYTRRRISAGCGMPTRAPSWIPRDWPGACGGRAWTQACASSSEPRCGRWPATRISTGAGITLATSAGQVGARRVALATGPFSPPLRRLRYFVIPVYDYVLMTEPLSADQLASIGWAHRQGVGDSANQFHYYRLTTDSRILWGGYDAIYYYGSKVLARTTSGQPRSPSWPSTSSRRSRSWKACGSATSGAA